MSHFAAVRAVVHEKELDILGVSDEQLFEAVGEEMASLSVGGLSNARHHLVASELTSDSRINTVGLSPGGLKRGNDEERGVLLRLSCIYQTGSGWGAL